MSKFKKLTIITISVLILASIVGVIANRYIIKSNINESVGQLKENIADANSQNGAQITLTPSGTGGHMGDTITIKISAKCATGLGGVDAILDWDKSKLEFTNQTSFPLRGVNNSTGKFNLSLLYDGDENEAELATLQFKILDAAVIGETLNISLSNIELIDGNIDSIGVDNKSIALNVTNHTFTKYVSDNNATCEKDGTKTAKCDKCSATETITDVGSKLGHSFTNYKSNDDATCEKDGTKTAKCDKCTSTKTITDTGSAKGHNYENYKCIDCGQEAARITITSNNYEITEKTITKISHQTELNTFLQNLVTINATKIEVLNKKGEVLTEGDFVGTGMSLVVKSDLETITMKLIVVGDTTGDGKADFKDMVAINKHRLNQKALEEEFLTAGDLTGDSKADFKDIVKLNKFRLNAITSLFQIM